MEGRRRPLERMRLRLQGSSNTSHMTMPDKTPAVDDLYRLELSDSSSPVLALSAENNPTPAPHSGGVVSSENQPPNSAPFMTTAGTSKLTISLRRTISHTLVRRRTPTPPPPYSEQCQKPLLPQPARSKTPVQTKVPVVPRQRTVSASSWMKNVISRQSSRSSLRQQYVQIPLTPEEIIEAENIKAERAREALAEWNRVNEELKAAGF